MFSTLFWYKKICYYNYGDDMKYLSNEKIENKNVILRCDFNVPVKDGKISDTSKIDKSLKTINFLLENNNRVLILSHFGRVKSEDDKKNNSLKVVYEYLKTKLELIFIENNLNVEFYLNTSKCRCFLLENTRFTDVPEKKESKNDLELAKYWASFADVFVVDAFGSLHRAHSSTAGISKFLPTYLGFLVEQELNGLRSLINNENKDLVVIMGGAKISDKIPIMIELLKRCDKLIITGGILNTFLKVMGRNVGKSLVSDDEEVIDSVNKIIETYSNKIVYNMDFSVLRDNHVLNVSGDEILDDDVIYDNFVDISNLTGNEIVFFNGTCGKTEDNNFKFGTHKLLDDLVSSKAEVFVGGGDTASIVNELGFQDKITYLSSGGGATLEYVAYKSLKALDYIEENEMIK